MRFTNLSLLALIAIFSVSVNAQVEDNPRVGDDDLVPRPGDDRGQPVPGPGQQPGRPGDDNVFPRPGDDRGGNSTTTLRPSPTGSPVPTNGAAKNSMGALGLASVFAYFLF